MPVMFITSGTILFAESGVIAMDPNCCCSKCLSCDCDNIKVEVTFTGDLAGYSNTYTIARSARGGITDCDWLMDDPYPILPITSTYHLGLSIRDAGPCGTEYYITLPEYINNGSEGTPQFWHITSTEGLMFTTNSGTGCFGREGFDPCVYPIEFTCVYTYTDDGEITHTSNVTIKILGCS